MKEVLVNYISYLTIQKRKPLSIRMILILNIYNIEPRIHFRIWIFRKYFVTFWSVKKEREMVGNIGDKEL